MFTLLYLSFLFHVYYIDIPSVHYLGCWNSKDSNLMSTHSTNSSSNSPSLCRDTCFLEGMLISTPNLFLSFTIIYCFKAHTVSYCHAIWWFLAAEISLRVCWKALLVKKALDANHLLEMALWQLWSIYSISFLIIALHWNNLLFNK